MSRGAPRGRGRGRGRGGFGFGFGDRNAAGSKEWHEALRMPKKHAGMLYPPMDKTSYLSPPTPEEESIISLSLQIDRLVSRGIMDGIGGGVPWRLPDSRKIVGIEIEQWSEKMTNPQAGPSHYPPPPVAPGQKAGGTDEKLDPDKLYMNPEFFPSTLWKGYFEGKMEKPRIKKGKKKKVDDEEGGGAEDEDVSSSPSSDDSDFNFSDEETDDQDYGGNYFDNGEGDDDSGGDSDDGGAADD